MVYNNLADAYSFIDNNSNQTDMVEKLFNDGTISYADIDGYFEDSESESYPEIFQWLHFPNFTDTEFQKLIESEIPVVSIGDTSYVGITSYGSSYDQQVYPQLIKAIFGVDVTKEDIDVMKKEQ